MTFSKSQVLLFFAVFSGILAHLNAQAQEKCGTVKYEQIRKEKNPSRENLDQFEFWMRQKVGAIRQRAGLGERTQTITYTIPVVVHVIHNGETVGTGTNISDAQIQSQIDVLNRDFPRLNADSINTPAEFLPAAGRIKFDFVLAKQDPEGLSTNGIVRVHGTKSSWTMADNSTFKALSYWPANNYLNLWVLNLNDNGLIGYAQLPESTLLPGLADSSHDSLTDGVAIHYKAFGNIEDGPFDLFNQFNKGRTATHEIGHIFGLRHIWGDTGGCSSTDYCNDTPIQDVSTNTCATQPSLSCGHDKMFQNYMDYTDDACMNLFTNDQVARMIVIVENSPRRASLITSPGASDPTYVPNDLGLKKISSPGTTACSSVTPAVVVRNYGTNDVDSAVVQFSVNGLVQETLHVQLGLAPFDSATVTFSVFDFGFGTNNSIAFLILQTNGGTDGKASNNSLTQAVVVPPLGTLPVYEPFNTIPATLSIINPDGLITWANVLAPSSDPNNKAMYMNFYDYEAQDEDDYLITPVFDLSNDTAAILRFDRAYAAISDQYVDGLRILVSTSCDFSNAVEIFNKSGSALATVGNQSSRYTPTSASDWKTETISLAQFLGQPHVQIAFVATNDYGNNLYIDNMRIITGNYTDLVLSQVKRPSPVSCESHPTPLISLRNNGSTLITECTVSIQVNGGAVTTKSFTGLQIDTGQEQDFTLDAWSLNTGNNTVTIAVDNPNEVAPTDNVVHLNEVVNKSKTPAPIRQDFNSAFPDWTIVSETQQPKWVSTATNKSISMVYDAFTNDSIGNKSWLVSPTLDFTRGLAGSMFFDLSYAKSSSGSERLQVLYSTDCGLTFPTVVFDQTGNELAKDSAGSINSSNVSWTPLQNGDWRRVFIALDSLAGKPETRIAFVVTNDHGNNVYVDNIEIFTEDDPTPVQINSQFTVYNNFQPVFNITFNLPESQNVRMQIFNMMGQIVIDYDLPNTLNQTYDVSLSGQQAGIYLVRLQMGNQLGVAKVMVPH